MPWAAPCVHDALAQAGLRDDPRRHPRGNRGLEQFLNTILADPLPPPGTSGSDQWGGHAERTLSAKELPVWVLDPPTHGLLIGDALQVLVVVEARHEPDGHTGPAIVGAKQGPELIGQPIPWDHPRQANQFIVHVQG